MAYFLWRKNLLQPEFDDNFDYGEMQTEQRSWERDITMCNLVTKSETKFRPTNTSSNSCERLLALYEAAFLDGPFL